MSRWFGCIGLALALGACGGGDKDAEDTSVDTDIDTDTDVPDGADADGDGFSTPEDCDDSSAAINPDADEICDYLDNDCDGKADLDPVEPKWFLDADADGFGDATDAVGSCSPVANRIDNPDDCDDTRGSVFPGAIEACNDIDDDCDPATGEAGVVSVNAAGAYAGVQAAVDAAVNDATIDLCAGTYEEAIITGKGLKFIGHGGRDQVRLDGRGLAPTLRVTGGLLTRVEGITLQNGVADFGGCLSVSANDLELVSARLEGCEAARGGGLNFSGDQVFATDTEFVGNIGNLEGGGIWAGFNSEIQLTGCTVSGNTADVGAGAFGDQSSDYLLDATTVADNAAGTFGGGFALYMGSTADVIGGAIVRNTAQFGGGLLLEDSEFTGQATDMGAGADDNVELDVFVVDRAQGYSWEGVADPTCDPSGCI